MTHKVIARAKRSIVTIIGLIFLNINISYSQQSVRPNIIVIVPDDMGWSDIGYNGTGIKSPNIDKLANEGVKLAHQYVMSTCTPTRIGILTGQYASKFGVTSPAYGKLIPFETPTIASLLQEKGYHTALVGKWHMGSPPYVPVKYGFQNVYGYLDGQIDVYTHNYKTAYDHYNTETKKNVSTEKSWSGGGEYLQQNNVTGVEKSPELQFPDFTFLNQEGHATDLITNQAIHIIENSGTKPFFIFLAYSVPHYPLNEPDEWISIYKDEFMFPSRKEFAASVSHMDDGIGKIVQTLENTGQRQNTLILFISDNGAQKDWSDKARQKEYNGRYAHKPQNVLGSNFPFRGWKGELYEGALRVPAFVNWPGHVTKGQVDLPTAWTDWLPTLLSLTGSDEKALEQLDLDGENIWPLIQSTKDAEKYSDRLFFWETPNDYAARKGDWKLIRNKKSGNGELYNIQQDFRENHEVSKQNPTKVQELNELIDNLKDRRIKDFDGEGVRNLTE